MNDGLDIATMAEYINALDMVEKISTCDGFKDEARQARRLKKANRHTILSELRTHDGMMALLESMQSRIVQPTSKKIIRGNERRDALNEERKTLTKVEQWVQWQVIVPAPNHHPKRESDYLAALSYYRPGGTLPELPPVLPQSAYACDFDERRGKGRSLGTLLDMVTGDGYEPLCAVPSMTEGNYHFWFTLTEQTWRKLKPPSHWGADPGYRRGVLAWNPIYRSFHPNKGGELTWWNARHSHTPPELFTQSGEEQDIPWSDEYERLEHSADGERYSTGDLEKRLKSIVPGQGLRHVWLMRYVAHHQAKLANEYGHHPSLEDHRRIAWDGNSLFSQPQGYAEVESVARWYWAHPFYELQKNRRARGKILKVSDVFECLDALVALRMCSKVDPGLSTEGFGSRYAEPEMHPEWSKYSKHIYFSKPGTTKHLADADERWAISTIERYLSLYKRAYESNPEMNINDDAWNMSMDDWMRGTEEA